MSQKVIIIGAGPGGLTVAVGASKLGFETIIIEAEKIGGDCTNYGCVPSKSLLNRAKIFYDFKQNLNQSKTDLGLNQLKTQEFLTKKANQVLTSTRSKVKEFQDHENQEWLEKNGVKFLAGKASFINSTKLKITGTNLDQSSPDLLEKLKFEKGQTELVLDFDRVVIATGSTALIPNISGIKDLDFLTNKTIFDLKSVPQTLTILGNGVVAVEMAQAFSWLGSKVTVISRRSGILSRSDVETAKLLQQKLTDLGIDFVTGQTKKARQNSAGQVVLELENGQEITAEKLLIAAGRKPNLDLYLEQAGVNFNKKGVEIKTNCQTSNSNIFAIGDVTAGYPNFTHFSGYMGAKVTMNLAVQKFTKLPFKPFKISQKNIPAVIFTYPELAAAGLTEEEAVVKFGLNKVKVFKLEFKDVDRAIVENKQFGFIKLICTGRLNKIIGVHILNDRAGEMLPEFQRLIAARKNIFSLSKVIRAYPTLTANLDKIVKEAIASMFLKNRN